MLVHRNHQLHEFSWAVFFSVKFWSPSSLFDPSSLVLLPDEHTVWVNKVLVWTLISYIVYFGGRKKSVGLGVATLVINVGELHQNFARTSLVASSHLLSMGEWVIGAFINLFGSIAINFGTNLLKLGLDEVHYAFQFVFINCLLTERVFLWKSYILCMLLDFFSSKSVLLVLECRRMALFCSVKVGLLGV